MRSRPLVLAFGLLAACADDPETSFDTPDAAPRRGGPAHVLFVAGGPSHGPGEHEYLGGAKLLAELIEPLEDVETEIATDGWPSDPTAFSRASTIVFLTDGNVSHPLQVDGRFDVLRPQIDRGLGLVAIHWSVHFTTHLDDSKRWFGGHYDDPISVNPIWEATFESLPEHPTTRGVEPFVLTDEWYYNLAFADSGVVPILRAVPPDGTRFTADAAMYPGRAETVAWAFERADGGRSFGITGAHFHASWGDLNFRRVVVNAILWTAGIEVPAEGAEATLDPPDVDRFLGN